MLKSQIPKLIEQNTYAKASIDSVYINPFLFKVKISNIKLSDTQENPLIDIGSLFIDFDPHSLIYGAINIAKVEVLKPHIYVVNNQDKTINLLNILKTSEKQEESNQTQTQAPRVIIGKLKIDDAKIHYTDFTKAKPFYFTFDQLDLELDDIDTHDFNTSDGAFAFYANLGDGAFVKLNTQIDG
ncbi:MAG: AsmA family protein, partial [Sulfurimonas sp.]